MHRHYLLEALELAKDMQGRCAPNPSVGCVAVKNGEVIAKANHQGAGLPHAEQALIPQLPEHVDKVELYVTLEPCNHWGKTPPCVDVIINSKVSKVVFAYKDPHPVVQNRNTPDVLANHGVEVHYEPQPEIDEFYHAYQHWVATGLPLVRTHGLNHLQRIEVVKTCRQTSDLILTSLSAIRHDKGLSDDCISKPVAVIDEDLQLSQDSFLWSTAKQVIVFHRTGLTPNDNRAQYIAVEKTSEGLRIEQVIQVIGDLGYHDIWADVPPQLLTYLQKHHLVKETMIMGALAEEKYYD